MTVDLHISKGGVLSVFKFEISFYIPAISQLYCEAAKLMMCVELYTVFSVVLVYMVHFTLLIRENTDHVKWVCTIKMLRHSGILTT